MFEYKKSKDDSNTLYSKQYNQHYHSISEGALYESFSKHINPAFAHNRNKEQISILDICYGLGYNTLCSIYFFQKKQTKIKKLKITSVELDEELICSLYDFQYPEIFDYLKPIIKELSTNKRYADDNLDIEIICDDARDVLPKIRHSFDIVYQDAFSYKKNPSLWTFEYFKDVKKLLKDSAIITTYSISTKIRLALSQNNFYIYDNIKDNKRIGTLASMKKLPNLISIDMAKKIETSSIKTPLFDKDIN